jgi:AmmeMemoRadiSam system protein B
MLTNVARVRRSAFAGQWYPADKLALSHLFQELFARSERRTGPLELRGARAFVVPHAAPEYSGTVAAAAYRQLAQCKADRIVVLGFSHFMVHQGVLIPDADAYRTPLGEIPVDRGERDALLQNGPFSLGDPEDHSVEVQLPYVQFAIGQVPVLPL